MPSLTSEHPVKKWITSQRQQKKPTSKVQGKIDLLNSILDSQFNLITDQEMKKSVIGLISEMSSETNVEKLLLSYMYLLIGNITHSDNILKAIIQQSPRLLYQGYGTNNRLYYKLASENVGKLLKKFSRHPSDRLTFYLVCDSFKSFFNQEELLNLINDFDFDEIKEKISLAYTAKIAPELVSFLRLSKMKEGKRIEKLRFKDYSYKMQSYWVWNFLDIDPLVSDDIVETLNELEKNDPLWLVYILSNEKISDTYFKKGGQPISRRRQFLRGHLDNKADFMLTLYKLIEIGDIDQELVKRVSQFMIHD